MDKLTELYRRLYDDGVYLFARPLPFACGHSKSASVQLSATGDWGIFLDTEQLADVREEYSAVLHEYGHYATGTTHAVTSPVDLVERHEYRANKWAVQNGITREELDAAVAAGYREIWELAEYFDVTEDYMRMVICWYTNGNLAVDQYM